MYTYPSSEANIVDQGEDVARTEVHHRQEGLEQIEKPDFNYSFLGSSPLQKQSSLLLNNGRNQRGKLHEWWSQWVVSESKHRETISNDKFSTSKNKCLFKTLKEINFFQSFCHNRETVVETSVIECKNIVLPKRSQKIVPVYGVNHIIFWVIR